MRRTLLSSVLAAGILLTTPPRASAQPSPQLTEEQIRAYIETARASGAPIREEDIDRLISTALKQQSAVTRMQAEIAGPNEQASPGTPIDPSKPLSHIAGKDGIPFPKPEEVIFEPSPTLPPSTAATPTPAPVWSPPPYARPGKCEKNETVRVEVRPEIPEKSILLDQIYVSEDLVPLDPQEVFGLRSDLIPYGPHEERGTFLRMKIDNVPCLPYRIRITERAQYYDSGINALKNYDSDPAGKGKLHTFIEQKLYPQKRRSRDK